ncbi:MAG TPA: hypothetical protein V6C52_13305 [Coleofasciculaceae cyanobacterium]
MIPSLNRPKLQFSARYDAGQQSSSPEHPDKSRPQGGSTPNWLPLPQIPVPWELQHNFNFQNFQVPQPQQIVHKLQNMPTERLYQNISNVSELLPVVVPGASFAPPLISTGYAGFDVYRTAMKEYERNKDLDRGERLRKTAEKTGSKLLYHLLATIAIPTLLGAALLKRTQQWFAHEAMPSLIRKRPKTFSIITVIAAMIALSGVISKISKGIINWTYDPLVRHKKPKQWHFIREKLGEWKEKLGEWQGTLTDKVENVFEKKYLPRPAAKLDWPDNSLELHRPNTFQSLFS